LRVDFQQGQNNGRVYDNRKEVAKRKDDEKGLSFWAVRLADFLVSDIRRASLSVGILSFFYELYSGDHRC